MLSGVDGDALRRIESQTQQHDPSAQHQQHSRDNGLTIENANHGSDTDTDSGREGRWGEAKVEDVSAGHAMQEYEMLRHSLVDMHKTKTTESALARALSHRSNRHSMARQSVAEEKDDDSLTDVEAGAQGDDDDFELGQFMREGRFEKRSESGSLKKVGVLYENLTVKGIGSTTSFVRTVPDAVLGTFGPDLYKLLARYLPFLQFRSPPTRTLIHDFTGCVRDGEMMLVLGRPGSGCSTFLKAVTNKREGFAAVEETSRTAASRPPSRRRGTAGRSTTTTRTTCTLPR